MSVAFYDTYDITSHLNDQAERDNERRNAETDAYNELLSAKVRDLKEAMLSGQDKALLVEAFNDWMCFHDLPDSALIDAMGHPGPFRKFVEDAVDSYAAEVAPTELERQRIEFTNDLRGFDQ